MLADLASIDSRRAGAKQKLCVPPPTRPVCQPAERSGEVHLARLVSYLRASLLSAADQRERGHIVYIDSARRYLGEATIGTGSIASLVLSPREILAAGFRFGASGMILAHNHPSGECRPSEADVVATQRLAWLGQMVEMSLLDHLIITTSAVYSMRARSLL